MYYSAGTYESFAHPEVPEGAEKKSAYIIGTGLAELRARRYICSKSSNLRAEAVTDART